MAVRGIKNTFILTLFFSGVAKVFFANPEIVSEITKVPVEIISGIADLIMVLKSGFLIDPDYLRTKNLEFIQMYKNSSVRKVVLLQKFRPL